jgi:threonine/homoserine/homoserine lactone efflux protein
MHFAVVFAGLMVCTAIIYTTLSGLILTKTEPTRTFAELNMALACISLVGGIYLLYAIYKMKNPERIRTSSNEDRADNRYTNYNPRMLANPRLTPSSSLRFARDGDDEF